MIKEALQFIVSLSNPTVAEINGHTYSNQNLIRMQNECLAPTLSVHTLTSIFDYITSGADECAEDEESINRRFIIHVADCDRVRLYRELNSDKERECLIEAQAAAPAFPFGRWMDMETFIINMQTYFTPSGERDALIQLAGTVTAENGVTVADDGITQQVTARSGISLMRQVGVPNPVFLAPFRTFTEIEQPASPFVFRMRREGDAITAALFSADANAWKREAIQKIREYFYERLPEEILEDIIILA